MIRTRITELLGIKHPVIQGAMVWVSMPPLVAAVSNAGGLGILGAGLSAPEEVRRYIREIKALTSKPFGVNALPDNPRLDELLDVIIEEKVKVVNYGAGDPQRIIQRTKPEGIISLPTVGAVRHAVKAEQDGADAVIVQGTEAGGHCSYVASLVLVPLVVDRVTIPVVAAGGFADGRGLVAALALGAEGVSMGTRFVATQESPVPMNVKQRYLKASEEDTVVTRHATGIRCRVLNNELARKFMELGERNAPRREYFLLGMKKYYRAFVEGDEEGGSLVAGQVVGLIDDLPTCRELIDRIISQAEQALGRLETKIRSGVLERQ